MKLGRIVVVEDDAPIRQGVRDTLLAAGYEVDEAADGQTGLSAAQRVGVDLVLLDLMLPKLDGREVLKRLRLTHATLPVIILTARGGEEERVSGLRGGADDYVVKPFSARELVARVEAVLRRSPERPSDVKQLAIGAAVVDFERREIRQADGGRQDLSETECAILSYLASNPGRAISREELLTRLWGISGRTVETRTVDMHVARLRAKLAEASNPHPGPIPKREREHEDEVILTVRGKGYMLTAEARPQSEAPRAEEGIFRGPNTPPSRPLAEGEPERPRRGSKAGGKS